jgi:hypothetical protein
MDHGRSDRRTNGVVPDPRTVALTQARASLARLADQARSRAGACAYERTLIELDRVCDEGPDNGPDNDLFITAAASIRELIRYGTDELLGELVLAMLFDARALDEP